MLQISVIPAVRLERCRWLQMAQITFL